MNTMNKLFEHRELIGSRLETAMNQRSMTKTKLCKTAGFSRPTLDKLLAGDINIEDNYISYMTKALEALAMPPEALLGDMRYPYVQVKAIRNLCRMPADRLSKMVGISADRLQEIENGGDATEAELRDIALLLETGVDDVTGENPFSTNIAAMDDLLNDDDSESIIAPSGFWGHVGLLPKGSNTYCWFPISAAAQRRIQDQMQSPRLVIPCMNNKLLYINTQNMKSILLLDEACDAPEFANCDSDVSEGEIPAVVYESYEDYVYSVQQNETPDPNEFSPNFRKCLQEIEKKYHWDEEKIADILDTAYIHYDDGSTTKSDIDFNDFETVTGAVEAAYNFEFFDEKEPFIRFEDLNGTTVYLNTNMISFMELPLIKTQRAIIRGTKEMIDED